MWEAPPVRAGEDVTHEDVVAEDDEMEAGVRSRAAVESAIRAE